MVRSRALAIILDLLSKKGFDPPSEIQNVPKERAGVRSRRGSPGRAPFVRKAKDGGMGGAEMAKEPTRGRKKWRAEVRPRLQADARDSSGFPSSVKDSFEGLVFAKVGNREAQGIDGDQLVGHARLENEDEIAGVQVALELAVIGGGIVDEVEIDSSTVRRG